MYTEKVTRVTHYNKNLFSFRTTRDPGFRFKNGEFAMIGIEIDGKPLFRAYSMVSTCYDDYLEFLSIKVPDGPLTSKLMHIKEGDDLLVKPKTTGSLCIDYLKPTDNLVMLATGTGVAPFMSIAFDFETYEKYKHVYLFHTTRTVKELAYHERLINLELGRNPILENVNFHYIDSVTREKHMRTGRFWNYIPKHLDGGFIKDRDSVMVCGSPSLNKECRSFFLNNDWDEGNTGEMGDFMLERAFVD